MAHSKNSRDLRKKPTEQQFNQWLVYVIQPLTRATENELYFLYKGNATWRFYNRALEHLTRSSDHVLRGAQPILAQFFRYVPDIRAIVDDHDRNIETLCKQASSAFDSLSSDSTFDEAVSAAHNAFIHKNSEHKKDWQGAHPANERTALAAEYLINNIRHDGVPYGYTTRDFWLDQGEQLLEFRNNPKHRKRFKSIDSTIESLCKVTEKLQQELDNYRAKTADSLGLPPVIIQ